MKGKEGNITQQKNRRLCQRKVGMQHLGWGHCKLWQDRFHENRYCITSECHLAWGRVWPNTFSKCRHNRNKFEKSCFWSSQPSTNLGLQHYHQCGTPLTNPLPAHPSQGLTWVADLLHVVGLFGLFPCSSWRCRVPGRCCAGQAEVPAAGCAGGCRTAAPTGSCMGAGTPFTPFVSSGEPVLNLALLITEHPFDLCM